MRIVIINKSDSTGGAAVVSRRLMEALRAQGADARMLVAEKLTDSPYVEKAAEGLRLKFPFLKERLGIFVENGFNRETLFKIDTGADGLPLWRHPLVKKADAILLNWVNQGLLSLKGVARIAAMGKPVIWTMHDMWNMTGICHHAGECTHFKEECGDCPLMGKHGGPHDLSRRVWLRKKHRLPGSLCYVAVSHWLSRKAKESSLLGGARVEVIPNAFPIVAGDRPEHVADDKVRILFGAARLDDPIKGLPVLVKMTGILAQRNPELARRLELVTFGGVKNSESLAGIAIPHRHLGMVRGEDAVRKVYEEGDILVSASSYETLPGTLVEAQAYGCIPVSFNQGGQSDIVDHLATGYIAEWDTDIQRGAENLADGIAWAAGMIDDAAYERMLQRMKRNVTARFSSESVATVYLNLINRLK
ncbi:MAG: glycosyltransferase [Muribaculaceae bacterium]|nr:glycosyltransferase [Muribaculaceae bacterium]